MPFEDFDPFHWMLYGGKETLAGLVLIALLLLLITGPERRKIRWAILFLVLHVVLVALRLLFAPDTALYTTFEFFALFLLCSSFGLGIFLLLTCSRFSQALIKPLPKIFIDILHTFVYVVAFLISLGAVGVEPKELFAGSALLTAVLGLSLRDTLGNLIAGLAIQAQRPFEVGDWIQYSPDASQTGQVTEINWRATRVVTRDRVEIVLPNALLAAAPIINYSRPEAPVRRSVVFHAPHGVRPQRVKAIALAALADTPDVLPDPAPKVYTSGFDERGTQFTIKFFIATFIDKSRAESNVRDRVWYALARHGIDMPIPPRSVRVRKLGKRAKTRRKKERIARRERALAGVEFFDHLPPAARRRLACRARTRHFAAREVIIRQGDIGDELFILESGEVVVTTDQPGEGPLEVARLGPGSFFGEMAALTGEPRKATVRALSECEVLVIGKAALAEVFAEAPEVAEHVSQTIAQRQANLNARLSEHGPAHPHAVAEHSHKLLERIKDFFSI